MKRREWITLLFIVAMTLALIILVRRTHAQPYPHQWVGIADNQGHTATISNGAVSVVSTTLPPSSTPSPTPTAAATAPAVTPSPTPAATSTPGPSSTATATPAAGIFARSMHPDDTSGGSGASLTVTVPSPVVSGDLLLGFAGFHFANAGAGTLPGGWTKVADTGQIANGSGAAMQDVLVSIPVVGAGPGNPTFGCSGACQIDVLLVDYAKSGGGSPVVDSSNTSGCAECNPLATGGLTSSTANDRYVVDFESLEANGNNLGYTGAPALNQLFFNPGINFHYTLDVAAGMGSGPIYNFYNDGGNANSTTIAVMLK